MINFLSGVKKSLNKTTLVNSDRRLMQMLYFRVKYQNIGDKTMDKNLGKMSG